MDGQRVAIERDGKTYEARFDTKGGVLTVTGPWGRKSTQLGNMPPAVLARQLLSELIREEIEREARGE